MSVILSDRVFSALADAGIVPDDTKTVARVVIDLQAGKPAVIHVRRFGDERLLDVLESFRDVEVVDSPSGSQL